MRPEREARLVLFCEECMKNFMMKKERFDGTCPMCGTFVRTMRCSRCGHAWIPRTWSPLPRVCPKCKSKYWNRERFVSQREE